jgi:hypothetical protein
VDPALLAGDARAALGPDGRFTAPAPPLPAPYPVLSQAEAESVLREYMRVLAPSLAGLLSEQRGAAVNVPALTPCGAAVYAESALDPVPDSVVFATRVFLGPFWMQSFCLRDTAAVLAGVGAYATPLAGARLDTLGSSEASALVSAAIQIEGLPVTVRAPMRAEEAAARVAGTTGARVTAVPRLVLPRPPLAQTQALWVVETDSAVPLRGEMSKLSRTRSTWLYGRYGRASRVTVWDTLDPDLGPYAFVAMVTGADGTMRSAPVVLARRPLPSFSSGLEPVSR